MIFSALLFVCACAIGDHGMQAHLDAVTLYFHERTLTKSAFPIPQLVCKNTAPSDGCARRRIVFAECNRGADEDWSAWACQGHGDEHDQNAPAGLELRPLSVRCAGDTVESCSLTYTLQFNNETLARLEREKQAQVCQRLYEAAEPPFDRLTEMNVIKYGMPGVWVGFLVTVVAIAMLIAIGDLQLVIVHQGLKTYVSLKRINAAELKLAEQPVDEKREQ